jgi:tetratricopeptide (TPR) repeat protein
MLGRLSALVDQGLLRLDEPVDGEPRLGMLETIRAYARERLAASGEEEEVRRRHAAWYMALAETAEPALQGSEQVTWLARLERERDNLRAALAWAREHGETEVGLRLAAALWRFWHLHGYVSEGREWLDDLLAQSGANGSLAEEAARAKALRSAGGLAFYQSDYERAWARYDDARHLYAALGDEENCAGALLNLGIVADAQGDYERAAELYEASLTLARRLEHESSVIAYVLENMGNLARRRGDAAQARTFLEESLALRRAYGDTFGIATVLAELSVLLREQGDAEQALTKYHESLALSVAAGYARPLALSLEGIAAIAVEQGQAERAARLAGAAAALRQHSGMSPEPEERVDSDQTVAAAQAVLGEAAFADAWAQGHVLQPEQAMAEACDT